MRGLKHLYAEGREGYLPSHLLQMRGLKLLLCKNKVLHLYVASFTDAWIETTIYAGVLPYKLVASFTDAWIETNGKDFW